MLRTAEIQHLRMESNDMIIPFVTFLPIEKELNNDIREAFDRVFKRSWYIEGVENVAFEKAFAEYC